MGADDVIPEKNNEAKGDTGKEQIAHKGKQDCESQVYTPAISKDLGPVVRHPVE